MFNGKLRETSSSSGSQLLRDLVYNYDDTGNLQQHTTDGAVETFGYDTLSRLVSWEQGAATTNPGIAYVYDDLGNMLHRQSVQFVNHVQSGPILADTSFVPGDGLSAGPHQIEESSLGGFAYDARGDQRVAPGRGVTYTSFGLRRALRRG